MGKFHGQIRPMTPTGSRVISTLDAGAHRIEHFAVGAQGLAGEIFEDVAGAGHFADAFGQGLAFLARQKRAEFGLAGEDFRAGVIEHVEALLRCRILPGLEGVAGSMNSGGNLGFPGLGVDADDVVWCPRD